jgi:cobalt-zinc-cadmium resistance protein CzcA
LDLRVCGPDLEQLAQLMDGLRTSLSSLPAIRALRIDGAHRRPQLRVQLDRGALAMFGIAISDVTSLLAAMVEGESVGALIDHQEQLEVVIRAASGTDLRSAFQTAMINGRDGASIPLSRLAALLAESVPTTILREQNQRCVVMHVTAPSLDAQQLIKLTQERLRGTSLPLGVTLSWDAPQDD